MNLTEEQKKGQEAFFRIISEAWENETFKKALLENPEEALEKFFGTKPPISKKIKVTDQSDSEYLYINIPIKPLIEHQLKKSEWGKVDEGNQNRNTMTDYEGLYDSLKETSAVEDQHKKTNKRFSEKIKNNKKS